MYYKIKLYTALIIILSISTENIFAQKLTQVYENYTMLNGLASNKVYTATQDKQGFIWFGTDNGVSRFDGKNFKNFTTEDGLPDNEIIRIFCDSKGRVWMIPFKQHICYYYKGKIHNQSNDSLVKKIRIIGTCYNIIENKKRDILIHDTKGLHIINTKNEIIDITDNKYDILTLSHSDLFDCIVLDRASKSILKLENNNLSIYKYIDIASIQSNDYITDTVLVKNDYNSKETSILFRNLLTNQTFKIPTASANTFEKKDSIYYASTNKGVDCYTYIGKQAKKRVSIFSGESINRVFFDNENNIYLLSNGKGIFKKKLAEIKNYTFQIDDVKHSITFIDRTTNKTLLGTNNALVYNFTESSLYSFLFTKKIVLSSKISFLKELSTNRLLIGSASCLYIKKLNAEDSLVLGTSVKYTEDIKKEYLVGGTGQLFSVDKEELHKNNIIWNYRTTCANKLQNDYYIGTLSGLCKKNELTGIVDTLGKQNEIFNTRIAFIKIDSNNVVWVGFANKGVVALQNDKIVAHITEKNGLPSNFIKTAYLYNNDLWIGTNKGIAKINTTNLPYKVAITYSKSIGMLSDNVNCIYADSSAVYIGTDEGLTYFKEEDIKQNSVCNLQLTAITVSAKPIYYDSATLTLNRNDNNIRFDFTAISYSSDGDIKYYYRLKGLQSNWVETRENYVSYPTLEPGNYTFELYAINKFGLKSETVTVNFKIEKYFYETNWFKLLAVLAISGIVALYIDKRIKYIKKQTEEKELVTQKIVELEQKALKAQMNPHFIFNSLNTVQHFIIKNDLYGANNYISKFAGLIRQTLDFSFTKEITLLEEIQYLENYLSIEKTRFENQFTYTIETMEIDNTEVIIIPPLLLQTFVENAIKHNIKSTGMLRISIIFTIVNNTLVCTIKDNGIGIHQNGTTGKGIELVKHRLEALNTEKKLDIYQLTIKNNTGTETTGVTINVILPLIKKYESSNN